MAVVLRLPGPDDVADLIEALHTAADAVEERAPELAAARRTLADSFGDELDRLPQPSGS
ncbi:hypothetical protein J3A78_003838 [Streptomyces sp. PvR006]|uniref:hypothetical protein n=1 Tax=Streptomyces sp. PvR006 TaxID=2817860 RepID=UPI001AE7916C|nr:hypothetical protein [Streptomyces sp. PvR006]MBP2583360.1 hypothetical protein [Streptomyces sp. PvR006]